MVRPLRVIVGVALCAIVMLSFTACGTSASSNGESQGSSPSSTELTSVLAAPSSATTDGAPQKTVYFAAPLFSQGEKDFNLKLTKVLEDHGYQVFLPQRDGYLAAELKGKTEEELTELIFDKDYNEISKADVCFALLDGQSPDEGVCVEIGIAYAKGKPCYAAKTDVRAVELNMDLNPMIAGCCTKIFKNSDGNALIDELDQYLSEYEL